MGMDGDGGQAYGRVSEEVEGQWRQLVRSGEVFADVRPASPAAGRVCCVGLFSKALTVESAHTV
jgi:hypothetical protein